MSPLGPERPTTEAGRALLEFTSHFLDGDEQPVDLTEDIIEVERAAAAGARAAVEAELLRHGQINVGTIVGYEAGLEEGRREAAGARADSQRIADAARVFVGKVTGVIEDDTDDPALQPLVDAIVAAGLRALDAEQS